MRDWSSPISQSHVFPLRQGAGVPWVTAQPRPCRVEEGRLCRGGVLAGRDNTSTPGKWMAECLLFRKPLLQSSALLMPDKWGFTLFGITFFGNTQHKTCDKFLKIALSFFKSFFLYLYCHTKGTFFTSFYTNTVVTVHSHFYPPNLKILGSWNQSGWGVVSSEFSVVRMLRM